VKTFLLTIDLIHKHNIHLWDAVIAATMKENDLIEIVTENKKDFDKIPNIKVSVPF
jgi:predicted nucleic acid-binding protein